jgi:hypothetical protein
MPTLSAKIGRQERYAMVITLATRPPTICRYCGVRTDSGGNHSCERECVEALAAEVTKTKRLLRDAQRPASPAAPGRRPR